MHEAGIARAVADVLRGRDLGGKRVRLHVKGGHHGEDEFDASLRMHLELEAPDVATVPLEFVHDPVPRLCASCGATFDAPRENDPCPECGGPSLPLLEHEQVEVELVG